MNCCRTGHSLQDLRAVLTYLPREVRAGRRNVGALKLSNLLHPDRFEEDLQISRVCLRVTSPPTQPASPFTATRAAPGATARPPACPGMPAPDQGHTPVKLHGANGQQSPHPTSEKPPRPTTTKPPRNIPSPLPGSPGNQMEKVHGKSEERYIRKGKCEDSSSRRPE